MKECSRSHKSNNVFMNMQLLHVYENMVIVHSSPNIKFERFVYGYSFFRFSFKKYDVIKNFYSCREQTTR